MRVRFLKVLLFSFLVVSSQNCGTIESFKVSGTQLDEVPQTFDPGGEAAEEGGTVGDDDTSEAPGQFDPNFHLKSTSSSPYLIILESDPSTYTCLEGKGKVRREFPRESCTSDSCLTVEVHLFIAHFEDGTSVEIQVDPAYNDVAEARGLALKVAQPLGQIPTFLRKDIDRGLLTKGEGGAYSDIGAFFLASDYIDKRINEKKLAHTIFHESIHAVLEDNRGLHQTAEWKSAQATDGRFITDYAEKSPQREDMAETALLAYALQYLPGRIPKDDEFTIKKLIPERLKFLSTVLPQKGDKIFNSIGPKFDCP